MVRDPRETTEMVVEAGAGSSENEVSGRPRNTGTKETSPFEAPENEVSGTLREKGLVVVRG